MSRIFEDKCSGGKGSEDKSSAGNGTPKRGQQSEINYKIYDSVFTDLFKEKKNQLRVYRELHPEDSITTIDDIGDVTIKAVLVHQLYNDLGFTVGNRSILLIEAQSKWSLNITLRAMMYLSDTFKTYALRTGQDYYKTTAIKLPRPELYVVYTGDVNHTEEEISLAETYWNGDNSFVDIKARVIYEDGSDSILSQYIKFTQIFKACRRKYGRKRKAVIKTIEECIRRDILRDYFQEKRAEVISTMMALYDEEFIRKMTMECQRRENEEKLQKELEKGREEGIEKGRFEAVKEIVASGLADVQRACEIIGVPIDGYRKYINAKS